VTVDRDQIRRDIEMFHGVLARHCRALLAELEQNDRDNDEILQAWITRTAKVEAQLAKVPPLVEALNQARLISLHDIRRAAFAPTIGVRYTEPIRMDIADQCRRLEDRITAALADWERSSSNGASQQRQDVT
jgi:hypothetical protein